MNFVRLTERAVGYYRLYGARRFFWAVASKVRLRFSRPKEVHARANVASRQRLYSSYYIIPSLPRVDPAFRPAAKVMRRPQVAVIGDLNLPQCRKYRVIQKLEAFEEMGIEAEYSHWEDVPRSMGSLQLATFAIFYRTRMNELFELYINECKRLKIPFAYDIDDPIFSEEIYRANRNLRHLDPIERNALLSTSKLHLDAMLACDLVIVSTPRMQEEVQKLTRLPVFLWRNAVDQETLNTLPQVAASDVGLASGADGVQIVYASGSRAHEADFREIAPDLLEILAESDSVSLNIIGYLDLPREFARFSNRITIASFGDYLTYMTALARSDINIIPLVRDDFNDCKSAIRYMEASLAGLPTIASNIGDFKYIIEHERDGLLASSSADWRNSLRRLISDAELRREIGAAAKEKVTQGLAVPRIAEGLHSDLKDLIHSR